MNIAEQAWLAGFVAGNITGLCAVLYVLDIRRRRQLRDLIQSNNERTKR